MADIVKKLGGPRSPYSKALADNLMNAQAPTANPGLLGGLAHVFAKGTGGYIEAQHAASEEDRRQMLSEALNSGDMTQVRAALNDIDPQAGAQSLIQDQRIKDDAQRDREKEDRQRTYAVSDRNAEHDWQASRYGVQRADQLADRTDERSYGEKKAETEQRYALERIDAQGKNKLAAISAKLAAGSGKFRTFVDAATGETRFQDADGNIYRDARDGTLQMIASRQPLNDASAPMSENDVVAAPASGDAGGAVSPDAAASAQTAASAPKRGLNMTVSRDGSRGMFASGVTVNLKRPDGSDIPDDVFRYAPDVVTANLKARDASVNAMIKSTEKRRATLEEAATSANEEMALVDQFGSMSKGAPRGILATVKSWGNVPYQAITGDTLSGVPQMETVETMQNHFMKEARKGFPGAVSDYENKLYKAASLGIDKSPMGTYLMSEILRTKAGRALQRSQIAEEYLADKTAAGITPVLDSGYQARVQAADKQTLLSPEAENILKLLGEGKSKEANAAFAAMQNGTAPDAAAAPGAAGATAAAREAAAPNSPAAAGTMSTSEPVTIGTDDEYDNLPSGAAFRGPDGKLRRKP